MRTLSTPQPCDYCSAPIIWLLTTNDRRMPVDAAPDPDRGNILRQGDRAAVLAKGSAAGARAAGQQLRTHHRLTCPPRPPLGPRSGPVTAPALDLVAVAARHLVTGWDLLAAHRHGVPAATKRLTAGSHCAGWAGRERSGNEMWTSGQVLGQHVTVHVDNSGGEPSRLGLRDVVAWAAARLADDEGEELARLDAERNAALHVIHPDTQAWHRQTYTPSQLTDDERARIARGQDAKWAAERAIRALADTVLARSEPPARAVPGEQLDLFGAA